MSENVAYRGQKFTIYYAVRTDGTTPAAAFLAAQDVRWQLRIFHLFRILGDHGVIHNDEQFRKFEDPFYEFKAFQLRMPCYFREGRSVVVTHGFIKKKNGAAPKARSSASEEHQIGTRATHFSSIGKERA